MARAPRTSAASYTTFKNLAWAQLGSPANAALNTRAKTSLFYDNCYTPTLDPGLAAKVALQGRALCLQMAGIFTATGNVRQVKRQRGGGAWPVLNNAALATAYQAWADWYWWEPISYLTCRLIGNPQPAALSNDAQRAMGAYLHIYPAAGPRALVPNWRIAFNILPQNMAAAVAALCPVMDAHADIGHFKISAPGTVGKPDSLIVYMNKTAGTYAGIYAAVVGAVGGLGVQETFAPMWDEFALGQAVASEPPKVQGVGGVSFGTFRCILTTMAHEDAVQNVVGGNAAALTGAQFRTAVDTYFNRYGVPIAAPHDQYQIVIGAAPVPAAARTVYITQAQWNEFLTAYGAYKQVNAMGHAVQNRPVIT